MTNYDAVIAGLRERRFTMPRFSCRVRAMAMLDGHETHCVIHDISGGGLGLTVDSIIRVKSGQRIAVSSKEAGHLSGVVKWAAGTRAGIEMDAMSRQSKQLRPYLAFLESQKNGDP